MTKLMTRIDGQTARAVPRVALCDTLLADGNRAGEELFGFGPQAVLGRWPEELDADAVVRVAQAVGNAADWATYAQTPPVAQKLAERARPLPLDLAIDRHLHHLQHVCHRPRLHLRVDEERLPVSRARRTPVRAVADLVAHPGDWEHRTLRSIQPARVLARQTEDEWDLYENRVAVRLVDHLLAYLAKRLEELSRIKAILESSRNHGDELRCTSFRRARRIAALWSDTLASTTSDDLKQTMKKLERARRDLQALLGAPLYLRVPRKQAVALSLTPTNILVNDTHYRKVAALWRTWLNFGHKRQETTQQRAARRQREALAWDQFVLHLVVRGFAALGWSATGSGNSWTLEASAWAPVTLTVSATGVIQLTGQRVLRLLPICANLAGTDPDKLLSAVEEFDNAAAEIVVAHVGGSVALGDTDRASGWSFGGRAILFACSPWGIDCEERMARLLSGWLCRAAARPYPVAATVQSLPDWPGRRDWLRYQGIDLVMFRAPTDRECAEAHAWAAARIQEQEELKRRAKAARQAHAVAPHKALADFAEFLEHAAFELAGMDLCPVCGDKGLVEPRPGKRSDGSDATWWATCTRCESEWGARPCHACAGRYRALSPRVGLELDVAAQSAQAGDWPDKVLGRDVWAQPCRQSPAERFRCPQCGSCGDPQCAGCGRGQAA